MTKQSSAVRFWGGFCLLLAACAQVGRAESEKYTLKCTMQAGLSWEFELQKQAQGTEQTTVNGRLTNRTDAVGQIRLKGTVLVLEAKDGQLRSAQITYAKDCQRATQKSGEQPKNEAYALAGRTITLHRFGDQFVNDAPVRVDPESLTEIRTLLQFVCPFFPDHPVAVGEEWKTDPKVLADAMHTNPNEGAELVCRLASVQDMDGRKTAKIEIGGKIHRDPVGRSVDIVVAGSVVADIATGRQLATALDATMNSIGGVAGLRTTVEERIASRLTTKITDDPRAIAAALAKPATRAARQGTLRLKHAAIDDPEAQCEACSMLIPVGWKLDGRVTWQVHPLYPAAIACQVSNPAGAERLTFYPRLFFVDGITAPAGMPPAAKLQFEQHFSEGSKISCDEIRHVVADPAMFLSKFVIPRYRPDLADAKLVAAADASWLGAVECATHPHMPYTDLKARRLRVEYTRDGKELEEDFYIGLVISPSIAERVDWKADPIYSMAAEKGKLDEATVLLQTVATSARVSPKWSNQEQQVAAIILDMLQKKQQSDFKIAQIRNQTAREMSDARMKAYEDRNKAHDRMFTQWENAFKGIEVYHDPFEDRIVELPTGFARAWVSPRGEFILTDNTSFDPIVDLHDPVEWKPISPIQP